MFTFQAVKIDTGSEDENGVLVMRDEKLVAVAVHLEHIDDAKLRGRWNVEAVFDRLRMPRSTFTNLDEMVQWLADHAGREA